MAIFEDLDETLYFFYDGRVVFRDMEIRVDFREVRVHGNDTHSSSSHVKSLSLSGSNNGDENGGRDRSYIYIQGYKSQGEGIDYKGRDAYL